MGWELFKNYLIAKEKFKPDLFLYENNKSAAQAIKDQISHELGVDLMHINSALVSAQNRQRFYAFNWTVDQPEDRGILLRDVLEPVCDEIAYEMQSVGIGYRGRMEDGKWVKRYESNELPKANALTTAQTDSMVGTEIKLLSEREMEYMVRPTKDGRNHFDYAHFHDGGSDKSRCITATTAKGVPYNVLCEPIRIPEYGSEDKARPVGASYAKNCGGWWHRMFSDNPNKQQVDMIAEPIRIGDIGSTAQAHRVYSCDGKSVTINAGGGGQGGKTGLYLCPTDQEPVNVTEDGKSQTIKAQYGHTSISNICCYDSTHGATGVATATDQQPSEQFRGEGKDQNAMKRIYEVRNGLITIKDKQYPIKLADGYYIIRKLTPTECERLQTLPDGYTAGVSNAQRYKALGNGWTAEVIIHILNGALKDVPRDEEIVVLSMYDGIATGRYCLDKLGFTNVRYYAYEIDKYAKQIAMKNYPDIIQCGDAFDLRHPDWTIGY